MASMTERKIFASDEDFMICNISDADRSDYVELHRQLNGEATLYLNPISKDMMWEQILDNADSVFSLFTGKGDYCGSIELQQPNSKTPEIGIDLLENKRNQGIKYVFEKMGAVKIGEEKTDFSRFVERFRKTAEEDGQDLEKFIHLFGEDDDEAVYCYSLNPNTFL